MGLPAAGDNYLSANPVAGLKALQEAIEAFSGAVSGPAMEKVGEGLQKLAHGIQQMASVYGDWAKEHPEAAANTGLGAGAGAGLLGGYLSWKMFSGVGRLFGFSKTLLKCHG